MRVYAPSPEAVLIQHLCRSQIFHCNTFRTATSHVLQQVTVFIPPCSLDKRSPVLLNSEVMDILVDRGALSTDRFSTAAPVEKQAAEYLAQMCNVTKHDRAKSLALRADLEALQLASSEVYQLLNLKPRTLVEVYLIVEDLDERHGDEAEALADKVLVLLEKHFPQLAAL